MKFICLLVSLICLYSLHGEDVLVVKSFMGSVDHSLEGCNRHGFWAKIIRLAGAYGYSVGKGAYLEPSEERFWVHSPKTCNEGFYCFFDRIDNTHVKSGVNKSNSPILWSACPLQAGSLPSSEISIMDHRVNDFFGTVPQSHSHLSLPQFQAWTTAKIFRPKTSILDIAQVIGKSLGFDDFKTSHRLITVHIRRGDKYPSRNPSLEDVAVLRDIYLPAIQSCVAFLSNKYPKESKTDDEMLVFVASDSSHITNAVSRMENNTFTVLNYEDKSSKTVKLKFRINSKSEKDYWNMKNPRHYDTGDATIGIIVDTLLLEQGDCFVGSHTSVMSKGVHLLRMNKMFNMDISKTAESSVYPRWNSENMGGWKAYIYNTELDDEATAPFLPQDLNNRSITAQVNAAYHPKFTFGGLSSTQLHGGLNKLDRNVIMQPNLIPGPPIKKVNKNLPVHNKRRDEL